MSDALAETPHLSGVSSTHWCCNKIMDDFTEHPNEVYKEKVQKKCLCENILCSSWNFGNNQVAKFRQLNKQNMLYQHAGLQCAAQQYEQAARDDIQSAVVGTTGHMRSTFPHSWNVLYNNLGFSEMNRTSGGALEGQRTIMMTVRVEESARQQERRTLSSILTRQMRNLG